MQLDCRVLVSYVIIIAVIPEWTIASRTVKQSKPDGKLTYESSEGVLQTAENQATPRRDARSASDDPDSEYAMSVSEFLKTPEKCCGSVMPIALETAESTGGFSRDASAGSVKDTDPYPPISIRDLEVTVREPRTIELAWTTPGDDFDTGSVSRYVVRLSNNTRDLEEENFDLAISFGEVNFDDLFTTASVFREAGSKVKVNFTIDDMFLVTLRPGRQYYLALRAYDDHNNTSPVSNAASFSLPSMGSKFVVTSTTTTTKKPPTTTTETTPAVTTSQPFLTTTASSLTEEQCSKCNNFKEKCVCECNCGKFERKKNKKKCKGDWKKKMNKRVKKYQLQQAPQDRSSLMELWKRYGAPPECHEDRLTQSDEGSKMCTAISGLRLAIDYFISSKDFCYSNYISDVLKRLEKRARRQARKQSRVITTTRTKRSSVTEEQCSKCNNFKEKCVCECKCGKFEKKNKKKCKRAWKRKMNRSRDKYQLQQAPQDRSSLMELWMRYGVPLECHENGLTQNDLESKMCTAISGLRMAIDYFVSSRDFCHSNYISDVLKKLEKKVKTQVIPLWFWD